MDNFKFKDEFDCQWDNECDDLCKKRCTYIPSNNLDVEIFEKKPIRLYNHKPLFFTIKVKNCVNIKNNFKIILCPKNGELHHLTNGLLVYIPNRYFYGYDLFQIYVEDECLRKGIESVIIYVC